MPDETSGLGIPLNGMESFGDVSVLFWFAANALVTIVLAAVIAYHPAVRRKRYRSSDIDLPKILVTYALIGMSAGFLFANAGPLVAFIVFGIGGLMRVRSEMESATETGRVLLVALIGLAVGLNLWNIAVLVTFVTVLVIAALERTDVYELVVTVKNRDDLQFTSERFRDAVLRKGCQIIGQRTSRSSSSTKILFQVPRKINREALQDVVDQNMPTSIQATAELRII